MKQKFEPDQAWDLFTDASRFFLVAGAIAAPLACRRSLRGSLDALSAVITVSALSKTLKTFWKEPRPDDENSKSFPSQHSGECFAAAVSLDRELGDPIGPVALGLAAMVALGRFFSGKHHLADVIAGAGLGVTAANLARTGKPLLPKRRSRRASRSRPKNEEALPRREPGERLRRGRASTRSRL